MKSIQILLLVAALTFLVPFYSMADHGNYPENDLTPNAVAPERSSYVTMNVDGVLDAVGVAVDDGIFAKVELKDVREADLPLGLETTHHFIAGFNDDLQADAVQSGTVQLRVISPSGITGAPITLVGMEEHFGTDLILQESGEYMFSLTANFADGKNRVYNYKHALDSGRINTARLGADAELNIPEN